MNINLGVFINKYIKWTSCHHNTWSSWQGNGRGGQQKKAENILNMQPEQLTKGKFSTSEKGMSIKTCYRNIITNYIQDANVQSILNVGFSSLITAGEKRNHRQVQHGKRPNLASYTVYTIN